jgi:hypothetical protein
VGRKTHPYKRLVIRYRNNRTGHIHSKFIITTSKGKTIFNKGEIQVLRVGKYKSPSPNFDSMLKESDT